MRPGNDKPDDQRATPDDQAVQNWLTKYNLSALGERPRAANDYLRVPALEAEEEGEQGGWSNRATARGGRDAGAGAEQKTKAGTERAAEQGGEGSPENLNRAAPRAPSKRGKRGKRPTLPVPPKTAEWEQSLD